MGESDVSLRILAALVYSPQDTKVTEMTLFFSFVPPMAEQTKTISPIGQ
jgi:hypothetical protein